MPRRLQPRAGVLGGGVTRAGEQLRRPVAERRSGGDAAACAARRLVLADLGDDLGVQAAAAVAQERSAQDRLGAARSPTA